MASTARPLPELPTASSSKLGIEPAKPAPRFQLPEVAGHRDVHDNDAKLQAVGRDFRSDTVTIPTERMFEAMRQASRGDDVYSEDETTQSFQASIAALTGKEAGLYVMSGTASNQLALRSHLVQPPYSVLLDARAHIHTSEAGALALISGATSLAISPSNGRYLRWDEDISPNLVLDDDIHHCPTKIIALENTLAGTLMPQEEIEKISREARARGVIMHLDGARIWNVAAKTGLSMEELCRPFDTVSLCLSKGLGAPIGSILVGPKAFLRKALHFRKLLGGGVRQVGPLVAAARVAIEDHFPKLAHTHALANWLQSRLAELGIRMKMPAETNMLWIDPSPLGFSNEELNERLEKRHGIKTWCPRIVVHHQIEPESIQRIVAVIEEMKREVQEQGKLQVVDGEGQGTSSSYVKR